MQDNRYFVDDSKAMREIEASRDLLAFMAFNLKVDVKLNRMYYEHSENKLIIRLHFKHAGQDWLLERNVVKNQWLIKHRDKATFTEYSRDDIINSRFA